MSLNSLFHGDIKNAAASVFSGGWVDLYVGHDAERYHDIMQKLDSGHIKYRGKEYTAVSRIAMHALQIPQVPASRGPTVTPYELQARLLSQEKLDVYYVEVKERDLLAAHKLI